MTQNEFEQLTGYKVSLNEYEVANAMYMTDNNTDKQTFCKMFVKMNLIGYVREQAAYTKKLRDEAERLQKDVKLLDEKVKSDAKDKAEMIEVVRRLSRDKDCEHVKTLQHVVGQLHCSEKSEVLDEICDEIGIESYLSVLRDYELNFLDIDYDIVLSYVS